MDRVGLLINNLKYTYPSYEGKVFGDYETLNNEYVVHNDYIGLVNSNVMKKVLFDDESFVCLFFVIKKILKFLTK